MTPKLAAVAVWTTSVPPGEYTMAELLRHYAATDRRRPWITSPRAMGILLSSVGWHHVGRGRWVLPPDWRPPVAIIEANRVLADWASKNLPDWS